MSCNDWERGEIVIPSAEWAAFKARIRDDLNKASERQLELATKLHAHLNSPAVKDRKLKGYDLYLEAERFVQKASERPSSFSPARYSREDADLALRAVVERTYGPKTVTVKVKAPRKNAFPKYGNTAVTFQGDEHVLHLDNETRTAKWGVHENNHACERARESAIGMAFFGSLGKIKNWTRGSGGTIVGNDENNRDSRYEGGGANYVKDSYPPAKAPAGRTTYAGGFGYGGGGYGGGYGGGRRW